MPRVRWCPIPVLCLLSVYSFWIALVDADCWYEDDKHDEGSEVATAEPCLNCTCSRGALLCYLRVCPKLPNPPPPGCILLHRYRTCCPELICTDMPNGGNGLEARSEPDGLDIPYDRTILANACVANGSIYGPGSAMDSSTMCEYCYCLGGKQTCVKPKCLLPLEGCTPLYEPSSCCPIHYNCTRLHQIPGASSTTTTTTTPKDLHVRGGCTVDGKTYNEGGKVLGVGHSVCDNCYCLRGVLRCEPLSCAPPLLGCTPVIKPGECCAASYNCSGTIEIQAKPNYGQYPIVSKEYAKLRKQVQQKQTTTEISNMPFYVIAESSNTATTTVNHRSPGTFGTTRQFSGVSFNPSTTKPYYYNAMVEESLIASENNNKHSTRSYNTDYKFPGIHFATSNYEFQKTNFKRPFSTTNQPSSKISTTTTMYDYVPEEKLRSSDLLGGFNDATLLSIVDSLLDGRFNRKIDNETNVTESTETESTLTTEEMSSTTTNDDIFTETQSTTDFNNFTTTDVQVETTTLETVTNVSIPVTVKTVLNSTDCSNGNDSEKSGSKKIEVTTIIPVDANEINKLAEVKAFDEEILTSTEDFFTDTTASEVTEINLESRSKISSATLRNVPNLPLELETILNTSKSKDNDYEFDYSEKTLPPSLPNLRIIPFVAADALDSKKNVAKDKMDIFGPETLHNPEFGFNKHLFSPPMETEGGFVPKEPPNLENFYDNAVTVPSITNAPGSNEVNCFSEGHEISHGQSVASESPCITCTCYYGNIVCQKPSCPIPHPACRKSTVQDLSLCCPQYVCDDEEAPTVVLDRHEGTSNIQELVTVAEGVVTPDPFRDVIRTEPAPNLQSLIVDMMPFLARKTTPHFQSLPVTEKTLTTTSTTMAPINDTETTTTNNDIFSLDKVLQFLFSNNKENDGIETTKQIQTTEMTTKQPQAPPTEPSIYVTQPVIFSDYEKEHLNNDVLKPLENDNSQPGVGGILKLAGCNIYGRMYRVGRIISELSGPCSECKCTEVGVQCKVLKC